MGTYYYLKNPDKKAKEKLIPVYEDDYIKAIFSIASKKGIDITDKMILKEIKKGWKKSKK